VEDRSRHKHCVGTRCVGPAPRALGSERHGAWCSTSRKTSATGKKLEGCGRSPRPRHNRGPTPSTATGTLLQLVHKTGQASGGRAGSSGSSNGPRQQKTRARAGRIKDGRRPNPGRAAESHKVWDRGPAWAGARGQHQASARPRASSAFRATPPADVENEGTGRPRVARQAHSGQIFFRVASPYRTNKSSRNRSAGTPSVPAPCCFPKKKIGRPDTTPGRPAPRSLPARMLLIPSRSWVIRPRRGTRRSRKSCWAGTGPGANSGAIPRRRSAGPWTGAHESAGGGGGAVGVVAARGLETRGRKPDQVTSAAGPACDLCNDALKARSLGPHSERLALWLPGRDGFAPRIGRLLDNFDNRFGIFAEAENEAAGASTKPQTLWTYCSGVMEDSGAPRPAWAWPKIRQAWSPAEENRHCPFAAAPETVGATRKGPRGRQ